MMRTSKLSGLTLVMTLALAATFAAPSLGAEMGKCQLYGKKGSDPATPVKAGVLTVEVNLPAPGWWNGDTPEAIKDGFEYCMAANIANRIGADSVKVVNVDFDALVAGSTKDYDLALSQVSITDDRKKVVEFSVPYFHSDIGVLVKKNKAVDEKSIKNMTIGVQQGTTGADFATGKLKPKTAPKVFPDTPTMFTALAAGQIDVAMTDTAIVLGQAAESKGKVVVAGQYDTGETYGAVYPKGSKNAAEFDKIIALMVKEGTMAKLRVTYLASVWGKDPASIPYFKP